MPGKRPCRVCGRTLLVGAKSLPEPTCHPCRRVLLPNRRRGHPGRCKWCGDHLARGQGKRYCTRLCANQAMNDTRRVRSLLDPHCRRVSRDQAAPGLGAWQRRKLLAKWLAQGRACAYCDQPATTIDHVIPLVRGGTNYEGNLAPCCKWCNSSKSGWLIVEWRTGIRLGPMRQPIGSARSQSQSALRVSGF